MIMTGMTVITIRDKILYSAYTKTICRAVWTFFRGEIVEAKRNMKQIVIAMTMSIRYSYRDNLAQTWLAQVRWEVSEQYHVNKYSAAKENRHELVPVWKLFANVSTSKHTERAAFSLLFLLFIYFFCVHLTPVSGLDSWKKHKVKRHTRAQC